MHRFFNLSVPFTGLMIALIQFSGSFVWGQMNSNLDLSFVNYDFFTKNNPDENLIMGEEVLFSEEFNNGREYSKTRPFRAPEYNSPSQFVVTEDLAPIVNFWVDIYTKYSTNQGVIHDMDNPTKIYAVIDFSDINLDPKQNPVRKELNRKRRVELKKIAVLKELRRKKHRHNPRIRFQLGQSDRMQTALFYSGRYMEEIEQVFTEEQVPLELARLPFVESSFNIFAHSKVGASGIWQIMPNSSPQPNRTRPYYDLRNHPIFGARMAARVLKSGKKLTGSWPLAVIGYNHGPSGVRKKAIKYKSHDISNLLVHHPKAFGFASRNFYPCFLAVLQVEKNTSHYFPKLKWSAKLDSVPYKLPTQVSAIEFLKWFNNDLKKARIYNPHLHLQAHKISQLKLLAQTYVEIPRANLPLVARNLAIRDSAQLQY